ncbi:MAG: winged helix-turn-helix transcriptional regulator [Verrucomicrobia bacterium]|nr:winged helix-turn-helix transcriptional regulator [Verrucomicrobiota bacterium]
MNIKRLQAYRPQAKVFKALGHPARLLILNELGEGERCVCDLTELVGARMATVSRHLSVLREAGLVEDEKRGAQVFYRLSNRCVLNFFKCLQQLESARAREQEEGLNPG